MADCPRVYDEPCLLFPHDEDECDNKQGSLCTMSSPYVITHINLPNLGNSGMYCWNCCYGWLLVSDYDVTRFSLWNPQTSKLVRLPKLKLNPKQKISCGILKSPALAATIMMDNLDPDSMVILFDCVLRLIIYCRLGDHKWFSVFYGEETTNDDLASPVNCNGTLFSIDPRGVDLISPICKLPNCYGYGICQRIYLVECCGGLFYVYFTMAMGQENLLFDVLGIEVFKFDHINVGWKKVRKLDDKVFFLNDEYAIACLTTEGEIEEGGHIYFKNDDLLYKFNIEDNTLSTSLLDGRWNIKETYCSPFWVMPDIRLMRREGRNKLDERGQRGSNEETKNTEHDNMCKDDESPLLHVLPNDVLGLILKYLKNPIDYINFRSVSRGCRSSAPLIRWQEDSDKFDSTSILAPWLMFTNSDPYIYNFVDPKFGGNKYVMKVPESLVEAKIRYSCNGWVLMSKFWGHIVFHHPLTKKIIELPKPIQEIQGFVGCPVICFLSLPTNLDYMVIAISHGIAGIVVVFYSREREEWDHICFPNDYEEFVLDHRSPTFYNGSIYVLSEQGKLGELGFSDDGECNWKILDKPKKIFDDKFSENFIVECDGRLLSVFVGYLEDWVRVFVLNHATMSWEKVESLQNYTLYLSRTCCFWKAATTSEMGNKIFFPRFYDNSIVYYSLDTGKYHAFSSEDAVVDYYNGTRGQLEACWFEPFW